MKKFLCFLLMLAILTPTVLAASGDTLVYITRTGECYHRDGCSYLKSRIEVTLEDAVDRGYWACSRCDPPSLTSYSSPSGDKDLNYYLNKTKDSEPSYSTVASSPSNSSVARNDTKTDWSRFFAETVDHINFRYLGFLSLAIVLIISTNKAGLKHEREINDAFRQGFLAAVDMDDNKAPRSNSGTKKHPASEAQLRINSFWVHGRRSYFNWYTTALYKSAYSEGYRMGKNDAENAADKEYLDFVNSYRQLKADYDYLQKKYAILTSDDFDDELE